MDNRYFVKLRPLNVFGPIAFTSSNDMEIYVECIKEEHPYNKNKIRFVPVEEGYAPEDFYQEDYERLYLLGDIIKKTAPTQHQEMVSVEDYLTPHCKVVSLVSVVAN